MQDELSEKLNKIRIDKVVEDTSSKFFKTRLIDMVEIEFRDKLLSEI